MEKILELALKTDILPRNYCDSAKTKFIIGQNLLSENIFTSPVT